jgi:hypothetical protein
MHTLSKNSNIGSLINSEEIEERFFLPQKNLHKKKNQKIQKKKGKKHNIQIHIPHLKITS